MVLGYATRREMDILTERVNLIDTAGTRGTAGLQVQIGEIMKDLAEVRVKVDLHEQGHQQELTLRATERREARRYALTTIIAAVATLVAVVALLLTHLR